jgi:site-specific recombinase XerD
MTTPPPASYPDLKSGREKPSPRATAGPTIADLIPSYGRHLRAEGKTPGTVDHTYLPHLRKSDAFLAAAGMPRTVGGIRREHVEAYIVAMQAEGKRPATVNLAYRSLQPFWKWCVEEDEVTASPMLKMKPPRVPEDPPSVVTTAELERLLNTCRGSDFNSRRDLALVSLLIDTGMRRGECAGLRLQDIDLDHNAVLVHLIGLEMACSQIRPKLA